MGCPTLMLRDETGKLELRSEVCYFFGCPKGTKGWSFYNPRELKAFLSANVVFLEDDYMIDQGTKSRIVLDEIQGKLVPDPSITGLFEDTPNLNPVSTPVPHRSERIARPPDRFIFLGKSYEAISKVHEQGLTTYSGTILDIDSGHWQLAMIVGIESIYFNQV